MHWLFFMLLFCFCPVLHGQSDNGNLSDEAQQLRVQEDSARSYARQGRWKESEQLLDQVIAGARAIGDSLLLARAIMSKGMNFEKQAMPDKALPLYYQSLSLHEARGDQFRMGIVHNNIGMAFQRLKRWPEAMAAFEKALVISEMEKDTEGIMIYTLNIGVVHQKLSEFDQATSAFHRALDIARQLNAQYDIALLTANLGTVAMRQGRYDDALPLLQRAIAMKDSLGAEHDLAHTTNSLAEVYYHRKAYADALRTAREAERLAAKYNLRDQLSEANRLLSLVYSATENYSAAYHHLGLHKAMSDSIFSAESDQAINVLHVEHETERKEAQISELSEQHKRSTRDKLIYLGIAILLLITGASVIYALQQRRSRDQLSLLNERVLHERQNQFFTNISHEFRTPLTLILGPLHQLRNKFRSQPEEGVLRTMQQNAERLLSLINQILDIAKFDMKTLTLKKESVDGTILLRGIASSFDSMAQSRSIAYEYDIDPGIHLEADRQRLEIVMSNLISNAFKFTPDHGRIAVHAKKNIEAGRLHIRVSDTGSGIAPENLDKVFDRYYHDDRGAHSDYEGAGIGLALSKLLVEMHDGTIVVTSRVNEGTTFTVTLPLSKLVVHELAAEYIDIPATPEAIVFANDAQVDQRPLVLLTEDRKDMRDYITSILQGQYEIISASNANDGWEQAITRIPDVIISDVMMPGKDGLEFCRELKTDVRTSHIPVMLLTARAAPEDRISGLETSADVYLTKPFIPQELELHVRNLVQSRHRMREFYSRHQRIEPARMSFNSVDEQFLQQFVTHLEAHFADEDFSVEQLADLMHLSRSQVHRKLTALTGQAPNRLIRTFRLKRAHDMVSQQAASIGEIAYQVGFSSPAYFTKCFVEEFGMTPVELREKNSPVTDTRG